MDFDPRDYSDERAPRDSRDGDDRDRDLDDDGLSLGRGPSSSRVEEHHDHRGRDDDRHEARERADHRDRDDARWPDRDGDPRDVFTRDLNLPRGRDREIVHDSRDREYTLRGSESRSLATVGAFRVMPARDRTEARISQKTFVVAAGWVWERLWITSTTSLPSQSRSPGVANSSEKKPTVSPIEKSIRCGSMPTRSPT